MNVTMHSVSCVKTKVCLPGQMLMSLWHTMLSYGNGSMSIATMLQWVPNTQLMTWDSVVPPTAHSTTLWL